MMNTNFKRSAIALLLALALLIVPVMAADDAGWDGVFRNGVWFISDDAGSFDRYEFGTAGDKPVAYDGQLAVLRGGTWYVKTDAGYDTFEFGTAGDVPVFVDGNHGVFRNGVWFISDGAGSFDRYEFGTADDVPVVVDDALAVFRGGTWYVKTDAGYDTFEFGTGGDKPVVTSDGEIAVLRGGTWYIQTPGGYRTWDFGTVGDVPVSWQAVEPTDLEVVSVEAITATTVNATFAAPATAAQAGEVTWNVVGVDVLEFSTTATATVAEGDEFVEATLATALPETGTYALDGVEFEYVEDLLEVVSVEALDATTIEVEFAEGTEVVEADLEDKIIQVLADLEGAEWMDATYEAGTLNTTTLLANFTLAGDDEFDDAVTYFVQADWATFDEDSFVARIAAEFVASFYKVTTEVIAYDNATIFFGALNQYGEEIDLDEAGEISITARLNGMAIPTGQIDYTSPMDNVTVERAFVVDDILRLTVKNTVGADVKAETVLQYTVIEGDTPVVTTFTLAANTTTVPAGDDVKFTVTARDQYNNPFDVNDNVQWEIDGEIVAGNDAVLINTTHTANPALEIAAFYIPNPAKNDVITIEVTASTLTDINLTDVSPADTYNFEEVKWFRVDPVPAGAVINKDALAYNATAFPVNATADDISIVFDYGTGANATKVFAYITTEVAGAYTFNVTHPLAGDAEADVWATITTTINPDLGRIDIEEIGPNELLAGGEIFKNITFWNVHDEQLNRTADNIALTSSELTVLAELCKADGSPAAGADNVSKLNLTGVNSGDAWVQLDLAADDDFEKRINFTIGGVAGVKTVDMDAGVALIQEDDFNDVEAEIIFDDGKAFAIMPVTFKNQYNDAMTVQNSSIQYTGLNATHPRFEFISLRTVTGNYTKVTGDTQAVTGIGVYATEHAETGDTFKFGVKTNKQAPTGYKPATVTATVSSTRNVTSFALSEDAVTLTIGGTNKTVYITTVDQYSNPRNVAVANTQGEINSIINVTSPKKDIVTNTTLTYVAPGNYSFWLEPKTSGGEVDVLVNVTGGNTNVTENDKKILVTVAASLKDVAVPDLVSGKTLQVFNGTNFTLVGDLAAGEKVMINLSALAGAGVDFSKINATHTINVSENAENFTLALANNKITLNATQLVAHDTAVSLNFRNDDNVSAFVNVTTGAAGQHDVVFSRTDTDAAPTVTKKGTIVGNIINGMATNLTNNEDYEWQDFTFTVDGALASQQIVRLIIDDAFGLEYPTNTQHYTVTGGDFFVVTAGTHASEPGADHVVRLRSNTAIPSGTEVTVRAQVVNATIVADATISVEVKRVDTGESDVFTFEVGEAGETTTVMTTGQLKSAIANQAIDIINFGQDITLTEAVDIDRPVTIDLKTFTLTDAGGKALTVTNDTAIIKNGNLALTNENLDVKGATYQDVTFPGNVVINVTDGKNPTFNSVTIQDSTNIELGDGTTLTVIGTLDLDNAGLDLVLNHENAVIDGTGTISGDGKVATGVNDGNIANVTLEVDLDVDHNLTFTGGGWILGKTATVADTATLNFAKNALDHRVNNIGALVLGDLGTAAFETDMTTDLTIPLTITLSKDDDAVVKIATNYSRSVSYADSKVAENVTTAGAYQDLGDTQYNLEYTANLTADAIAGIDTLMYAFDGNITIEGTATGTQDAQDVLLYVRDKQTNTIIGTKVFTVKAEDDAFEVTVAED